LAERTGFELSAPFLVCQTTAKCCSSENTGNFPILVARGPACGRIYLVFSGVFVEIPYSTEEGISKREQGIILLEQGIFFEQQGSRVQVHRQAILDNRVRFAHKIPQTAKSLEDCDSPP
jgi:hypothetical protein